MCCILNEIQKNSVFMKCTYRYWIHTFCVNFDKLFQKHKNDGCSSWFYAQEKKKEPEKETKQKLVVE